MAAGSPIAALEPARPASPLKALSVWGAGLVQSQPPAFPAKMSKLWARPQGSDFGLWAPLSAITRARRWLMLSYRRRIWLRESEVPQGDGRRGGRGRVPPRAATPARSPGSGGRPRRDVALGPGTPAFRSCAHQERSPISVGGTSPRPKNCPENHYSRGFAMSINPKSTAAIGDHPLHPMIIPFPVAFLVGAPIADLAFIGTGDGFWARAAIWLIGAGIVMALVAAVAGFTDFFTDARIRSLNDAWYHMVGNLAAVVLALINFYLRYAQGAEAAVKPWGVALSLIVVGILLFTGWKGWEMVYRHHVAVLDAPGQTSSEPVTPHHGGERHRRAA